MPVDQRRPEHGCLLPVVRPAQLSVRFIREDGDKHLLVKGPDGLVYRAHKFYAGKNPSCSVSFCGRYSPIQSRLSPCPA